MTRRVLLVASTTGYQTREFASAAEKLGIQLVLATDRCRHLEDPWGDAAIPVRFHDPAAGLDALAEIGSGLGGAFDGIVAVGDRPAYVASQAAAKLGLRFSPPDAVAAAENKFLARECFRASGLLVPNYRLVPLDSDPWTAALATRYPCVLKPLGLSASRGVIRANSADEFMLAFARIKTLIERLPASQIAAPAGGPGDSPQTQASLQVEDFIPGREFALEGLVTDGRLQALALFDKPDPLDGPYFEETIYLTPSREPASVQQAIKETTQRAIRALGLTYGPVHAEMRVNPSGVWMLEVAPRPIGGLCSRVLRFQENTSLNENQPNEKHSDAIPLEELILRHSLGDDVSQAQLAPGAHGVMMIPIPHAGVYSGVDGLEEARAVPCVQDVIVTAKEGQALAPLPEGASYLGFIFAHAAGAGLVEDALRESHRRLSFRLTASLPVVR